MTSFLSVFPLVIRRFAANAKLLAAVVVGAVLASALLSTTSIYTAAIRDLGLKYALHEAGPDAINLSIRSSGLTTEKDKAQQSHDAIENDVRGRAGGIVEGSTWAARTTTFYPAPPGQQFPPEDSRPRANFQYFEGLADHVNVVDGRLPQAGPAVPQGEAPDVEVALSATTAAANGIAVGDRFDLFPFWDQTVQPVHVTVVGLIEPKDQEEPYWLGIRDAFDYPSTGWATYPFFVDEGTLFDQLGAYLPGMSTDYWDLVYVNPSHITTSNALHVRDSLNGLQHDLPTIVPRTSLSTQLTDVLSTYDQKLFFTRIPLLVLVLQIAAIVLYYLFMVSTMLVERQAGEITLLKSRGATTAQVMQIYVIEGLLVLIAAVALGPPLAAIVISLLGHTPPFHNLTGGSNLHVALTLDAYLWAAAGALLAYVTLLWPAYRTTRRTVVQQRAATARPPKQPAFTRYYLDLVLVGLGAILYYQLNRSGSLTTQKLFGDQQIDPVRLLTPAFFILTVGIVFLRIFPLVLRALSWVVARLQGSAILIGMWQLVRNPVHYSRLVLLLMLATAVGTFAASFGTTLERSYDDRAAYEAGAPLRLSQLRSTEATGPSTLAETIQQTTDAEMATPVYRLNGTTSTPNPGVTTNSTGFDLLGVDPNVLPDISYFRSDFASSSEKSLLSKIATNAPAPPMALPADARWLGFWFDPTELRGRVGLEVELRDATGRYFAYDIGSRFGDELDAGWYFAVIDLQAPTRSFGQVQFADTAPAGPMTFESISVVFGTRFSLPQGAMLIDDLQTSNDATLPAALTPDTFYADPQRDLQPFAQSQVLDSFDSVSQWQPLTGLSSSQASDDVRTLTTDGYTVAELRWDASRSRVRTHGLQTKHESSTLPVLASKTFLDQTGAKVGDTLNVSATNSYLDVTIVGSFNLFPTLEDPRNRPALIADGDALAAALNASPGGTPVYPTEVWMKPRADSEALANQAVTDGRLQASVISEADLRAQQNQDPLVAAGWEGILFISFAAILLLSAVGFLIYSYLTAQKRTLEFAVLRTMGFSRGQIATVVGFEQFFIIGLGMLAGTLLGLRLGTLMIRYMGVTETGSDVLPPMLLHVSWSTIGAAWLVLGGAFFVTIAIVVLLYSRLALHRVLRIGET